MKTGILISPGPAGERWRYWSAVAALVAVTLAFASPLLALVRLAVASELFSYILLVPLASAWLLHLRAASLPPVGSSAWVSGGLCLLLAELARFGLASVPPAAVDDLPRQVLAYYALLLAVGFLCLGQNWMRASAFPTFFLCFLIPWPEAVVHALELASQTGSAWVAQQAFELTGMPVFRAGFVFELAGARIQVAQECSGIRSSVALLLSGLLAAHLLLKTPWRRVLLVAALVPLGLLRNGARIWLIGALCVRSGPQMIHSFFHTRGGPVFFALSLVPFLALLRWLMRQEKTAPLPAAS